MAYQIIFVGFFLFLPMVTCADRTNVIDKVTKDAIISHEVAALYSSMSAKSSPLYICDPEDGGIEWLPPADINCEHHPRPNDSSKVVNVTLFWSDISINTILGYECSGTVSKVNGWKYIWSKLSTVEWEEPIDVTPEDCWKMQRNKISPEGDILHPTTEDTFDTGKVTRIPSRWHMNTFAYAVVNYKIQEVRIGIAELDGDIRTTAFTTKQCNYKDSSCPTEQGILVWESSQVKTCRLLEGETTECLFRNGTEDSALTCPQLKLFMKDLSSVEMCGKVFGTSSVGVFFLQNENGDINDNIAIPEQVRKLITRPRHKRAIANNKINPFDSETKANLNYLYDTIKKGTAEAVWALEQKICEVSKKQVELISAFAHSGHPSLTTRIMYKNPKLRADFSGDILTIFECIEVYEYRFIERLNCTFEYPIEYVYNDKIYTGYMTPSTHTIVQTSTARSIRDKSRCPKFYFKTNDYVALLSGSIATKVNIPSLPQPETVDNLDKFLPSLSFKPGKKLNPSSDDELESLVHIYRLSKRNKIEQKHKPKTHFEFVEPTGIFSRWFGWIPNLFGSVFSYIRNLLIWGIVIAIIVGLIVLLSWAGAIKDVILAPFKLIKQVLRMSYFCCGCKGIVRKVKQSYQNVKGVSKENNIYTYVHNNHTQNSSAPMYPVNNLSMNESKHGFNIP